MNYLYIAKHVLFSLIPLALSVYFFVEAHNMPATASFFPKILAVLVALFSILMIAGAVRDAKKINPAEEGAEKINLTRVAAFVAGIALYIYFIPKVGYFIATPLFMIMMYAYLRAISLWKSIVISVCFSVFIYCLFVWFLKLPIPLGYMESLLIN